jgi:hypothetical protein
VPFKTGLTLFQNKIMTVLMLKNKHVKLSIEIILFYKTTLSAMKKWPHNRGGLSHDEDNFVAFGLRVVTSNGRFSGSLECSLYTGLTVHYNYNY